MANVLQGESKGDSWCFIDRGDGYFEIRNKETGKALDVSGISRSNGANVYQWSYVGQDNQLWRLEDPSKTCHTMKKDKYYHIISKNSDKALAVTDGSKDAGANVVQWSADSGAHDNWTFLEAGNGFYKIVAEHSGFGLIGEFCLFFIFFLLTRVAFSVENGSKQNMANVLQGSANGNSWCLVARGDGYYEIRNKGTEKCLDVSGISKSDGANVYQWSYVGQANQLWRLEDVKDTVCESMPTDQTFHILAQHSNKALSVADASQDSGANIEQTSVSTGTYDNWSLEDAGDGLFKVLNENSGFGLVGKLLFALYGTFIHIVPNIVYK